MPIKRGGQTRSNAGRYAPEGQGATQRGRNLPTPSGKARPMQTARLPRAAMPGTVTSTGAARTAGGGGGGGVMSRLSMVLPHLAAAAAGLSAGAAKAPGLSPEMKKKYYEENKRDAAGKRQTELRNQQMKMDKSNFDDAFSMARNQGRQEFSWRGRRYTTEMAEG